MRKFEPILRFIRINMGWYFKVVATVILSVLGFIGVGVIETRALEGKVNSNTLKLELMQDNMYRFHGVVKEDIGHIKGQNDLIIKLLNKQGDKDGR